LRESGRKAGAAPGYLQKSEQVNTGRGGDGIEEKVDFGTLLHYFFEIMPKGGVYGAYVAGDP